MNYDRVRIGVDGRISPTGTDPRRARFEHAGEYDVHAGPPGTLLLSKPHKRGEAQGGRVLMMGEVISRMTIVEVINIVISTNWRGDLHVADGKGARALTIDQGALKHAQTEHESERLGQQLIGAGLLSRKDLERYLHDKPIDRRLGQILVEDRLLSPDALFKQLQRQAETIFYSLLLSDSGHYWFVTPEESSVSLTTMVHLPLQAMLMEGVQRLDEMALFREHIPHNRMFPSAITHAHTTSGALDPSAMLLLELCDGARDIDELARLTAFGEFPTLKLVYGLLRTGQIELLSGPTLDSHAAELLVRQFNDIMRDIFLAVATYGSSEPARRAISRWIEGSAYQAILGSETDVDGTLHAPTVLRRLEEQSHTKEPLRTLHQALHELIAYALFTVSNNLPRHEEQSLSREVNHRLKQLKL